ncbi:uncharacterized protein HKW66_Vig0013460 [Vigna angularis]|uniref:Knottins-like domain-containing protein n=2 Tax=Phaseolus angularis TaxID=3914 RepID=A0A8T0LGR4_PHAAN|nr:uncharacterized protein HKW66_Vig0013460 [Vigna angularis]BAT73193.1 hypothetical protein VIGAN_01065800 [Vigna angularis var. angularis]
METKVLRFMLLLFLVLADDVTVKRTEAEICWSPSRSFKGLCLSSGKCARVCRTEGNTGGKCKGFLLRCHCSSTCCCGN